MNYFYDLLPLEIQEIIIREASASLIQTSWYKFINNKMIICKNFIKGRKYSMYYIPTPPINIFDINNVLNIEQASRIITGKTDDHNFWLTLLFDIYDSLEYYSIQYRNATNTYTNSFINNEILFNKQRYNLYKRVDNSYTKLCETFSIFP